MFSYALNGNWVTPNRQMVLIKAAEGDIISFTTLYGSLLFPQCNQL